MLAQNFGTETRSSSAALALVDEVNHRAANEAAVAIATIRLAMSARDDLARADLLTQSIERLEGFADACRILCTRSSYPVDIAGPIAALCEGLVKSRSSQFTVALSLDLPATVIAQSVATAACLIICELVTNALKHSLRRGGLLRVALTTKDARIVLSVADDGHHTASSTSFTPTSGGQGRRIVEGLVKEYGGSLATVRRPSGMTVTFTLPVQPARDEPLVAYDHAP